jgi:hypothetical protein
LELAALAGPSIRDRWGTAGHGGGQDVDAMVAAIDRII